MTEHVELTQEDEADLARLYNEPDGGEAPSFHPVLQVWREVLKPAKDELTKKVTPQWASRMVQSYPGLTYADMNTFRDRYYGKFLKLAEILEAEIATDDECLSYSKPEEDVEHNSRHYKNVLIAWQEQFLRWELAWECTDSNAAIELGCVSEIHKAFFAPTGIVAFLDNIKFEYNEADQAELAAALQTLKEASGE